MSVPSMEAKILSRRQWAPTKNGQSMTREAFAEMMWLCFGAPRDDSPLMTERWIAYAIEDVRKDVRSSSFEDHGHRFDLIDGRVLVTEIPWYGPGAPYFGPGASPDPSVHSPLPSRSSPATTAALASLRSRGWAGSVRFCL